MKTHLQANTGRKMFVSSFFVPIKASWWVLATFGFDLKMERNKIGKKA